MADINTRKHPAIQNILKGKFHMDNVSLLMVCLVFLAAFGILASEFASGIVLACRSYRKENSSFTIIAVTATIVLFIPGLNMIAAIALIISHIVFNIKYNTAWLAPILLSIVVPIVLFVGVVGMYVGYAYYLVGTM